MNWRAIFEVQRKLEMCNPVVSVILPVHNGEKHIAEAIGSILSQSWTDFELLVIDDGSTDNTVELVTSFDDKRIRLLQLGRNYGLIHVLNLGVQESKGEFIARMDSDDVSLPDRLRCQIDFLRRNPECGVCGSWAICIDKEGRPLGEMKRVTQHDSIHAELYFNCPMIHPSIMGRAWCFKAHPYRTNAKYFEDYALWIDMVEGGVILRNIPIALLKYRSHEGSVSKSKIEEQRAGFLKYSEDYVRNTFQLTQDFSFMDRPNLLFTPGSLHRDQIDWTKLGSTLVTLVHQNEALGRVNVDAFRVALVFRWWVLRKKAAAWRGVKPFRVRLYPFRSLRYLVDQIRAV